MLPAACWTEALHTMRMRKKSDLPQKICQHCGRPFSWRKKWEKVWEQVLYCSDRCRGERRQGAAPANLPNPANPAKPLK